MGTVSRGGIPGLLMGNTAERLINRIDCALLAVKPTGQALYLRHCAACHGISGKGDGPVAPTLREPPADLTTIARRAGGRFDESRVMSVIDGRRTVAEHGTREMPVWGAVFTEDLQGERYASYLVLLQGRSLTDYVRAIQER